MTAPDWADGFPEPPDLLRPDGQTEWWRLCRLLKEEDRLEDRYLPLVEAAAKAYQGLQVIEEWFCSIGAPNLQFMTSHGGLRSHPALGERDKALKTYNGFLKALLLTPESRKRQLVEVEDSRESRTDRPVIRNLKLDALNSEAQTAADEWDAMIEGAENPFADEVEE